jgi:hypothetical protein
MAQRVDHPGEGHVGFRISRITKLKAVVFWVSKQHREGAAVTIECLNAEVIHEMIQEMMIAGTEPKKDDKLYYPKKIQSQKVYFVGSKFQKLLGLSSGQLFEQPILTDFNAKTTFLAGQITVIFPAASLSYDQQPK